MTQQYMQTNFITVTYVRKTTVHIVLKYSQLNKFIKNMWKITITSIAIHQSYERRASDMTKFQREKFPHVTSSDLSIKHS